MSCRCWTYYRRHASSSLLDRCLCSSNRHVMPMTTETKCSHSVQTDRDNNAKFSCQSSVYHRMMTCSQLTCEIIDQVTCVYHNGDMTKETFVRLEIHTIDPTDRLEPGRQWTRQCERARFLFLVYYVRVNMSSIQSDEHRQIRRLIDENVNTIELHRVRCWHLLDSLSCLIVDTSRWIQTEWRRQSDMSTARFVGIEGETPLFVRTIVSLRVITVHLRCIVVTIRRTVHRRCVSRVHMTMVRAAPFENSRHRCDYSHRHRSGHMSNKLG
jgi:hypothetical protein